MQLIQSSGMQVHFSSMQAAGALSRRLECSKDSTDHIAKQPALSRQYVHKAA